MKGARRTRARNSGPSDRARGRVLRTRYAAEDEPKRRIAERAKDVERPFEALPRHQAAAIEQIRLGDAMRAQTVAERRRLQLEKRRLDAVGHDVELGREVRPSPNDVALRLLADGDERGGAPEGAGQDGVAIAPLRHRLGAVPEQGVMDGHDRRHRLPPRRPVLRAMQHVDAAIKRRSRQRRLLPKLEAVAAAIEGVERPLGAAEGMVKRQIGPVGKEPPLQIARLPERADHPGQIVPHAAQMIDVEAARIDADAKRASPGRRQTANQHG